MQLTEINKKIAKLNPFTDKEKLKPLLRERRRLEKLDKIIDDIGAGDIPAMLQRQSGI